MKTLGQYIKEKRKEIRLTQEKLGEKLNTSQAAVNTWEHGNGYPNRLNLIKLANVFNVEPKELVHLKYKAKIKDSMFEVPPSPTGVITFSVGKGGGGGAQAMTQDGVALTSMEHPYVENKPVAWVDKIWFERPDLAAKIDYDDIFSRTKYANQVPLYEHSRIGYSQEQVDRMMDVAAHLERNICAQIAHDTYEGFGAEAQGVDFVKKQIIDQIRARDKL